MINLTTCVKGQKLRLRNKEIIEYSGRNHYGDDEYKNVAYRNLTCLTYTDSGSYFDGCKDMRDVIEILPLETTEPASHPSIAWWESCPWITDRKPTEKDGDESGWVMTKLIDSSSVLTAYWPKVKAGDPWFHRPLWKPPALTDKEQAMELINNHEDGWRPTPKQWHIIRKGLEAL